MKALITVVSLGLGVSALALVLAIQQDPFTLTSHRALELSPVERSMPTMIEPVTIEALVDSDAVVQVKEEILKATPASLTPSVRQRMRKQRHRVTAPAPEPPPTVVPAPCVDGEYRKLEENRGVRLMCPGQV
jgi:hypothetical protein